MPKYTPQGLYEEFRQFTYALDNKTKYPEWENVGEEGKRFFAQTSESMNRLAQEATMFEHHICVGSSSTGRQTLTAFKERVPTYWNADFFELWETDEFIFQFFRTPEPVNQFLIGKICQGLPERIIEDQINKKVKED